MVLAASHWAIIIIIIILLFFSISLSIYLFIYLSNYLSIYLLTAADNKGSDLVVRYCNHVDWRAGLSNNLYPHGLCNVDLYVVFCNGSKNASSVYLNHSTSLFLFFFFSLSLSLSLFIFIFLSSSYCCCSSHPFSLSSYLHQGQISAFLLLFFFFSQLMIAIWSSVYAFYFPYTYIWISL